MCVRRWGGVGGSVRPFSYLQQFDYGYYRGMQSLTSALRYHKTSLGKVQSICLFEAAAQPKLVCESEPMSQTNESAHQINHSPFVNVAHDGLLSLNDIQSKYPCNYLHGIVMAVARQKQHGNGQSCYLAAILQTTLCRPGEVCHVTKLFNHSTSALKKFIETVDQSEVIFLNQLNISPNLKKNNSRDLGLCF